jgi:hypothetical protein
MTDEVRFVPANGHRQRDASLRKVPKTEVNLLFLAAPKVVYSSTRCQWDVPEFRS